MQGRNRRPPPPPNQKNKLDQLYFVIHFFYQNANMAQIALILNNPRAFQPRALKQALHGPQACRK